MAAISRKSRQVLATYGKGSQKLAKRRFLMFQTENAAPYVWYGFEFETDFPKVRSQ